MSPLPGSDFTSSTFASGPVSFRNLCPGECTRNSSLAVGQTTAGRHYLLLTTVLYQFTGMVGLSSVFDIIWMARHGQNGFIRFVTILILILKVYSTICHFLRHSTTECLPLSQFPTFLALGISLRARGAQFSGLGGDIASATGTKVTLSARTHADSFAVWSMPGGFSSDSRGGYQNVDEELGPETPRQPMSKASTQPTPPPALGPYQAA